MEEHPEPEEQKAKGNSKRRRSGDRQVYTVRVVVKTPKSGTRMEDPKQKEPHRLFRFQQRTVESECRGLAENQEA